MTPNRLVIRRRTDLFGLTWWRVTDPHCAWPQSDGTDCWCADLETFAKAIAWADDAVHVGSIQ